MASVNSVQNDNSMLSNVVRGVAIGSVTGYMSKYMLPVTKGEKSAKTYQTAMKIIKRETNALKGNVIEQIRNLPDKTPAQDAFIKMVDAKGDALDKLRAIKGLSSENRLEVRNIVSSVNDYAKKMFQKHVTAYEVGVTKRIRPGFVGLGAFTGFIAAVAYNVMKTEVRSV